MPTHTLWRSSAFHRRWLFTQAEHQFDFFQFTAPNPKGGFYDLDEHGQPLPGPSVRALHSTGRMVHCFAIGQLLGRPGAANLVDHGMNYLWNGHRDTKNGGYFWGVGDADVPDPSKQAYGHAFVLLAGSSAKIVGHPLADRLIADVTEVLLTQFWEKQHGLTSEEYAADWSKITDYRGQNSNMHLTEALMAAFEATHEHIYLDMAISIAEALIHRITAHNGWRLPEHFHSDWTMNNEYIGSQVFRPSGSTPGHWLEWTRLLLQLWCLSGKTHGWMVDCAKALFHQATMDGWDKDRGGFYYTVNWDGTPLIADRLWWPACEGIGAAAFLAELAPDPQYELWYQKIWNWTNSHLIEQKHKSWHPQLDDSLRPIHKFFTGRPDIYHALQACLIPLFPTTGSLTQVIPASIL